MRSNTFEVTGPAGCPGERWEAMAGGRPPARPNPNPSRGRRPKKTPQKEKIQGARERPLSRLSFDVVRVSYANMGGFLRGGRLPPRNSVRLEGLVNFFRYAYPQGGRGGAGETPPPRGEPFSVNMEVAECLWQEKHL